VASREGGRDRRKRRESTGEREKGKEIAAELGRGQIGLGRENRQDRAEGISR
jgi:hypothetical protein